MVGSLWFPGTWGAQGILAERRVCAGQPNNDLEEPPQLPVGDMPNSAAILKLSFEEGANSLLMQPEAPILTIELFLKRLPEVRPKATNRTPHAAEEDFHPLGRDVLTPTCERLKESVQGLIPAQDASAPSFTRVQRVPDHTPMRLIIYIKVGNVVPLNHEHVRGGSRPGCTPYFP